MSIDTAPTGAEQTRIDLEIGGMTCASCAMRIEKKLNKLDGIEASVNYATEKARVTAPAGYDPALLIAEVEKTGYTAVLPAPKVAEQAAGGDDEEPAARSEQDQAPPPAPGVPLPGEGTVHRASTPYRPRLLTVDGLGQGSPGRRSR